MITFVICLLFPRLDKTLSEPVSVHRKVARRLSESGIDTKEQQLKDGDGQLINNSLIKQ